MPVNRVSATITQQDVADVMTAIATINTKLPFLVDLTEEERKALPKFSDKSLGFMTQALELVTLNTDFLPRKFDVAEMRKDVQLYEGLITIRQSLSVLAEKLESTHLAVGAEAYSAALVVYSCAKSGKIGVEGLDAVVDELGRLFARKSGHSTPPAPTT